LVEEDPGHLVVGELVQAAEEVVMLLVYAAHQVQDDGELFIEARAHAVGQLAVHEVQGDLEILGIDEQVAGKLLLAHLAQEE
jgi:hypothetical protein